jgi:hypothetical protein
LRTALRCCTTPVTLEAGASYQMRRPLNV